MRKHWLIDLARFLLPSSALNLPILHFCRNTSVCWGESLTFCTQKTRRVKFSNRFGTARRLDFSGVGPCQFWSPAPDFPSLSWSGMAWAGATRQTAIAMSRFVRGIFSAKGGDHRRKDAERISWNGTLGWFWRCFRVVTHYCHAITIATQDQRVCSILLKQLWADTKT